GAALRHVRAGGRDRAGVPRAVAPRPRRGARGAHRRLPARQRLRRGLLAADPRRARRGRLVALPLLRLRAREHRARRVQRLGAARPGPRRREATRLGRRPRRVRRRRGRRFAPRQRGRRRATAAPRRGLRRNLLFSLLPGVSLWGHVGGLVAGGAYAALRRALPSRAVGSVLGLAGVGALAVALGTALVVVLPTL